MRNQFEIQLQSAHMLHPTCRHLRFVRADGEPLPFNPGQFIQLHLEQEGEVKRRSYSIATVPNDPHNPESRADFSPIEMAVSYFHGGLATGILADLKPGGRLLASGPYGRFCLQDDRPARYLLVATGTGVTPYRSMLPEIARRIKQDGTEFVLLFGVRHHEELLYGGEFAEFARRHERFTFHPCYSRAAAEHISGDERSGYVQECFTELHPDPARDLVYLCGNPDMIDNAVGRLEDIGFDHKALRREKYLAGR